MTQEITIRKDKMPVVMKNDLVHWVSTETHTRVQEALNAQSGHSFMKVSELGITLNTAEIAGVYTLNQYQDMVKLKQGMWQCEYQKWHKKREECECKKDAWRKLEEIQRAREIDEENKPLTDEEKAINKKQMDKMRKDLEALGVLKKVKTHSHGTR